MFRYIAFAWDEAVPQQCATARRLSLAMQTRARWCIAFQQPGLHVYVADKHQRANGVYAMQARQGVVLGKLFRRSGLAGSTAQDVTLTDHETDQIVRSGGRSLVRDFWGRYIAFVPTASGATRIVRDPSGTLPCFMVRQEDVWIVFSWLEDVLANELQLPQPGVNWDGLAGQLLYGELGGRETALQGVTQVLPGEALDTGPEPMRSELLWNAVDMARTATSDESTEAAQELRHTVRACTQAWAACYDDMLFRLSGGVDSSILLSCLTRNDTPASVTCVNFHSPGADSDERAYARLAAVRAGRELVECERDTTFRLDSILQIARTPTPANHVGRMNARMDARLAAEHGATAMFTGAGGDQLFYEFLTWWPAADYLRSRGLDAGFPAAAMDAARLGRVSVWNAMARAFAERLRPSPPWQEIHKHLPLLGAAAWGMAPQHMRFVHPVLHEIADLPIGKATQLLSLVHPVPYYDPFERDAAPEAVHPLLSQPLVEMCLQLPTWVLSRGGRGRALARRAFAGDLPPQIAGRRSKGGMEEHVQAVLLRHIDFARSMLLDGELVRRGLLDRKKVEDTLSGRPTVLASHTGRVHVYIAIEAWLQRWSATPARATA